ncbi:MAG: VOC family protein [Candidatus Eremiobacteraeota bacterium]|nr:VOC family protein [Candidatus Eremiobacteraeota bacterium]
MKMHLHLRTRNLQKSVAFYETLLNSAPLKHYPDYALFITERPGLELALGLDDTTKLGESAHYGIVVENTDAVDGAIERLQNAGIPLDIERDETCCYAKQTKAWATDPEGRRWEVYTVHEDTAERDNDDTTCCATVADTDVSCCPA